MDIATISQVIGSLGFPIVACVACGWYLVKIQSQNNDAINKMSEALNNNTEALRILTAKIDSGGGV